VGAVTATVGAALAGGAVVGGVEVVVDAGRQAAELELLPRRRNVQIPAEHDRVTFCAANLNLIGHRSVVP